MIDLSIILPSIRTKNWERFYNSILPSIGSKYTFEVIFVGPYCDQNLLFAHKNVKYFQDWGSPTRALQIALLNASGKYIYWASDDGIFTEGSLEKCLDIMENDFETGEENKGIVLRYHEGGTDGLGLREDQYMCGFHEPLRSPYIDPKFYIFNCAVVPRQILLDIGGFDAENFEVIGIAFADLGIRFHKNGMKVKFVDLVSLICEHTPGDTGDHHPIHHSQISHDQPMIKKIWGQPEAEDRIVVDLNNHERSPEIWERRFEKDGTRKH